MNINLPKDMQKKLDNLGGDPKEHVLAAVAEYLRRKQVFAELAFADDADSGGVIPNIL